MGFLDLPAPVLTWLDGLLAPVSPVWRISLWAVFGSVLSMALYWLFSAQEKIARLKKDAISARHALASYDGKDFDAIWPLSRNVLMYSGKHFLVVFWPAVIASFPILFLITWISNSYGYRLPTADTEVRVQVIPESAEVVWSGAAVDRGNGAFGILWPVATEHLDLLDKNGISAASLPLRAAIPVVHKKRWWNFIVGNPAGYLNEDVDLDELRFEMKRYHFLDIGPEWARSWEVTFFAVLVLCSLAIKIGFRIH
jgi:hypothetical protein